MLVRALAEVGDQGVEGHVADLMWDGDEPSSGRHRDAAPRQQRQSYKHTKEKQFRQHPCAL